MVHPGAYRGNKRQKELKRLQKQEEKRQKRMHKTEVPSEGESIPPQEPLAEPEASQPSAGGSLPAGTPEPALTPAEDGPPAES